jgi:two-component system CheB/CheR fusion protein
MMEADSSIHLENWQNCRMPARKKVKLRAARSVRTRRKESSPRSRQGANHKVASRIGSARGELIRVVGVGASAGGLAAFRAFFSKMPVDSGAAFLLVQHLDPSHKSAMTELLAKSTKMTVVEAAEAMQIQPNRVYMIPPASVLTLEENTIRVRPTSQTARLNPVSILFESLANQRGREACAVILSGMGHDGLSGVQAIKRAGGFVVVQSPDSAQASGMPESAISMADDVVSPEFIPRVLLDHWRRATGDDHDGPNINLEEIERALRARTNHDFSHYKRGTIRRRVQRRMALRHMKDLRDYATLLRAEPEEADALFQDLLIGVTEFFREPKSWPVLKELAIEPILKRKDEKAPVRAWVPGCATGQEAYSVAIVFLECMEAMNEAADLKIMATDLNPRALEIARAGVYTRQMVNGISVSRLKRFFTKLPGEQGYRISKDVRDRIVFAEQSLTADPPFSKLDLITCRNVLIYLEPDSQQKVISLFNFALGDGGYLFLGNSESIGGFEPQFTPLSKKWRLYQKADSSSPPYFNFPLGRSAGRSGLHSQRVPLAVSKNDRLTQLAQRLVMEHLAPASVLVDLHGFVHYYCGPTHEYLVHPTGVPTNELFHILRPGLRARLRDGLQEAARKKRETEIRKLRIRRGTKFFPVSIRITPVEQSPDGSPLFLIVFDERRLSAAADLQDSRQIAAGDESVIRQLEYDLKVTREDLQSGLEELETTNEELKAANEEAMSVNEELQSSNEELETSKEELQSLNEELTTVNNQLHTKVDELEEINNDIQNLVSSSDFATVFLDREFRVRRFTPAVRAIFPLLPSDIGRPISDFAQNVADSKLLEDAAEVLKTLVPRSASIHSPQKRAYIRRVLPYRTAQDRVDGVVVTFADVTEREAADLPRARLAAIVESSDDAIVSKNLEGIVQTWNAGAERIFGFSAKEMIDQPISKIIPPERLLEEVDILKRIRAGHRIEHFDTIRLTKSRKPLHIALTVSPVRDINGVIIGASKIARDVTERKLREEHQKVLVAELDHRVKNMLAVVSSLATQTIASSHSLEDFGPAFEGRIHALAHAHKLLSKEQWKGTTLTKLLEQVVLPFCRDKLQCGFDKQDVVLPARAALTLSLVFHELATNASKYGALSVQAGSLRIGWDLETKDGKHALRCSWTETDGPPVTKPVKTGFGSKLIERSIQYEYGGKVKFEYDPKGLRCTIEMAWAEEGDG